VRGKAPATLQLEQAILDIAKERAPTTIRGIAYVLFVMQLIDSMKRRNTRRVSEIATYLREQEILDWRLIVDNSRPSREVSMWSGPVEVMQAAKAQYRRDQWQDQPYRIEIWSEKATVGGILSPVIEEWGTRFTVMVGYGSYTRVREAVERGKAAAQAGKKCLALYVGDWDPSGMNMSEKDLPRRVAEYGADWQIKRIAITKRDHRLPSFPAFEKRKDSRYPWFVENFGHLCWELDAMDTRVLRRRVEKEIARHVDMAAWNHGLMIEQAEKEALDAYVDGWPGHANKSGLVRERKDRPTAGGAS
jgi:hypothetical protein